MAGGLLPPVDLRFRVVVAGFVGLSVAVPWKLTGRDRLAMMLKSATMVDALRLLPMVAGSSLAPCCCMLLKLAAE